MPDGSLAGPSSSWDATTRWSTRRTCPRWGMSRTTRRCSPLCGTLCSGRAQSDAGNGDGLSRSFAKPSPEPPSQRREGQPQSEREPKGRGEIGRPEGRRERYACKHGNRARRKPYAVQEGLKRLPRHRSAGGPELPGKKIEQNRPDKKEERQRGSDIPGQLKSHGN